MGSDLIHWKTDLTPYCPEKKGDDGDATLSQTNECQFLLVGTNVNESASLGVVDAG